MARKTTRRPAPDPETPEELDPDAPLQGIEEIGLSDEPLAPQAPPADAEDEADEDEIKRIFTSNDLTGGYLRIYRRGALEPGYTYCTRIDAGDFDIDNLKKLYGGGTYRITAFTSKGKYFARKTLHIDERIKGELDVQPAVAPAAGPTLRETIGAAREIADLRQPPPAAPAAPPDTSRQDMMLALLMKSMETQAAIMTAALTHRQADSGSSMKEMMPLLIALVTKPDSGMNEKILTALLTGRKEASIGELVGAMKDMKALTAESEEPKGIMDNLAEVLPGVMAAFAASKASQAPQLPAGPVRPALPAGAPGPAARPSGAGPDASPAGRPANQFDIVINAARRDSPPELYAELVLDNLSEEQEPILKTVLTSEAWFGQLFGGYPDAAALRPWLTKLRDLLLDALNAPPDGEPAKNGDGGAVDPGERVPAGVQRGPDAGQAGQNP